MRIQAQVARDPRQGFVRTVASRQIFAAIMSSPLQEPG
jgi:hypothetical protein